MIKAPFTPDQVVHMNRHQHCDQTHPFTCVHRDDHPEGAVLVATVKGWICPFCEYTQDWAHEFQTRPSVWDWVGDPGVTG